MSSWNQPKYLAGLKRRANIVILMLLILGVVGITLGVGGFMDEPFVGEFRNEAQTGWMVAVGFYGTFASLAGLLAVLIIYPEASSGE